MRDCRSPPSSGTGAAPASHAALAATDARMRAGAAIYRDECSACHRLDGHGTPYLFPDLVSDSVSADQVGHARSRLQMGSAAE